MIRLYQFATSPFCAKVRKILDFKGIDYEAVEVDYVERKELVIASGQMMVPALTLDNGETMVDDDFDKMPDEGIIAWQLHAGYKSMEVTFKDIEFKDLGKK